MVKNRINPTRTCFVCGGKIRNRNKNAMYCKDCVKVVRHLTILIHDYMHNRTNIYPDYVFTATIKVIKKRKW